MSARGRAVARTLVRIAAVVIVAIASVWLIRWVEAASDAMPQTQGRLVYLGVLALALAAYAALLAIPYVPGVELGLTILMMQGPGAALPVYLATLGGLILAFVAGKALPVAWVAAVFRDAGLRKAAELVERVDMLTPEERLSLLSARLPRRLRPLARGWRHVVLALILNLPGNWLIGGGGGIMLVAGLSGLFRPGAVFATIAIAVAPVPLAVWFLGIKVM